MLKKYSFGKIFSGYEKNTMVILSFVEVITMTKQQGYGKTTSGASIQKAKQASAGYGAEFSTESTDVQQVRKQNAQAEARKSQASSNFGSQSQSQQ
ncbi:gamma-type small acid-soluble spore protein [Bacillus sp. OTU530]|uniref:gamma-type small acid-soluble spore protein n=1 Tax=Bacillus sp. OTU530 TaxID=3043862 RepID=UPI00406D4060